MNRAPHRVKNGEIITRVYSPPIITYISGVVGFLIAIAVPPLVTIEILKTFEQLNIGWFLVIALFVAFSSLLLNISIRMLGTRLIISPQGIFYYGVEIAVYSRWRDIGMIHEADATNTARDAFVPAYDRAQIAFVFRVVKGSYPLMLLWQLISSVNILAASQTARGRMQGDEWDNMITNIPVGRFDKQWRDTEIGDYLRQYASHVFAVEQQVSQYDLAGKAGQWRKDRLRASEDETNIRDQQEHAQALTRAHSGLIAWLRIAVMVIVAAQLITLALLLLMYSQLRSIVL